MAQPRTLTDAQVALLRWIAIGCPAGVMAGNSHRISAAALGRRGLSAISGRGTHWKAAITPAGRAYLRQVDGLNPPRARRSEYLVSKQLLDEVLANGGVLRVPAHHWDPPKKQCSKLGLGTSNTCAPSTSRPRSPDGAKPRTSAPTGAAARAAHPPDADSADWIAWVQEHADRLDPLQSPPAPPQLPVEIRPEDLKPFMERGFSPTGRSLGDLVVESEPRAA